MKFLAILIILAVGGTAIIGPQALFVVDETQIGIVTRFGEAIRSMEEPGLYGKTPFVERVIYLDKRLLVFDAPPDSLLTKDKKRLIIDVYARGKIVDPIKFVNSVATEGRGASRAIEIISSELRREIGLDDQSEIIRTNREDVMNNVKDAVEPKLGEFGIEIVDVRIKRADFPSEIAASVHERMKAERQRIADRERSEGARTDAEVRADVDKQATIIRSAAQRDADIIRGCGEADAIRIFATSLEQDPEFYTFQRSLEAYGKYLTQNATIVGSAGDLGQLFEEIRESVVLASAPPAHVLEAAAGAAVLENRCGQIDAEDGARRVLGNQLNASGAALVLVSSEEVEWGDSSLGCPQEDQSYAQVITPGFRFSFDHDAEIFRVHTNVDGTEAVVCTQ